MMYNFSPLEAMEDIMVVMLHWWSLVPKSRRLIDRTLLCTYTYNMRAGWCLCDAGSPAVTGIVVAPLL